MRDVPYTLYTPTQSQFDNLIAFLSSDPVSEPCPLPILPTKENYPRCHPSDAFNYGHIFRDRYERRMGEVLELGGCAIHTYDWLQIADELLLTGYRDGYFGGEQGLDDDWAAAAEERLKMVTPSSKFGMPWPPRDGSS